MTPDAALGAFRAAIVRSFPELEGASFTLLAPGWHSDAVDVDDRLVFKFPRHEAAEQALAREARLLGLVRTGVTMPVPDLRLHAGPPMFSHHGKLRGEHLLTRQYEALPERARQELAEKLGLFYAEIHRLDRPALEAAGARPIEAWIVPEEILRRIRPVLPEGLCAYADRTVAAWQELAADPHGTTYGFFDGHGWNMAFDHAAQRLNGVYDSADSGFGDLQQEFIYSNFISRDLTARIVGEYEVLTGRHLDRQRIELLSSVLRLSELAGSADDPEHLPAMLGHVADWAARGTV
ncbi:phosphotransferase family enzyme [Aminobacter aminovorans]|uniref:Phosphotransferase enzyme family n=1 Tax=Aminobacter aminovorans TaxID=83263 RepID=A0A380WRQ3_AMIAI|nr:aminoglycoside phosphotransferase family protein [Aminobacter aminovorans]TCS23673.1 phosphotransferase family enzyme [Aminobacter aminovorans]SUU91639.1 Phosphotransferase enzyme family [Aminobacter aminovorans]